MGAEESSCRRASAGSWAIPPWLGVALAVGLVASACETSGTGSGGGGVLSPSASASAAPSAPTVLDLPSPRVEGGLSVEAAMAGRRSVRAFEPRELTVEEISQLLWALQGVTSPWGGRTAPSAGALYPLEVYVVTAEGLWHYLPAGHRIEVLGRRDLRAPVAGAALGQSAVADAPAVFVIAAVYARTEAKYGDRAARYVQLEAGHAAQNLLLLAVSLGLGAVTIGAFDDAAVQRALALPADRAPLYLIPVGHPAE